MHRVTSVILVSAHPRLELRPGACVQRFAKIWIAGAVACLAALVLAALILPKSFRLTALSDVIQSLLLFSCTVTFVPRALQSRGRLRLFWMLMVTGMGFWLFYQLFWTYYEVWLR